MARVRDWVIPSRGLDSGCYWIIDDTGFPKKGKHSVGVVRQYCGQLGKQDNCQVAVSLSLASVQGSIPIAYRLYLPKDWAADSVRRKSASVPEDIAFATKPEIALQQMRWECPGAWCWQTPVMAMKPPFGTGSLHWACATRSVFALAPRYGHRGLRRCRPKPGRGVACDRRSCVASPAMSR
jgi:hypothetical protein